MLDSSAVETTNSKAEVREQLTKVDQITREVINEIKAQYLEDSIPWVIGFSGGKDSTAILQLIFYALSEIPSTMLNKEIHVLSNDTLVENPNIVRFIDEQLDRILIAGKNDLYAHNPDLFAIQIQWNYDGNFRYSVSDIYSKIKGKRAMMPKDKISDRRKEEFEILEEICKNNDINPDHIKELMELEREHLSFLRRHNIFEDMRIKIEKFVKETDTDSK